MNFLQLQNSPDRQEKWTRKKRVRIKNGSMRFINNVWVGTLEVFVGDGAQSR
jgi:hypothetical protein